MNKVLQAISITLVLELSSQLYVTQKLKDYRSFYKLYFSILTTLMTPTFSTETGLRVVLSSHLCIIQCFPHFLHLTPHW